MSRPRRAATVPTRCVLTALLLCAAAIGPGFAAEPLEGLTAFAVPDGRPTPIAVAGRVLHVVFFAAWCPPCVEELERLVAIDDRWAHDDYRLVLVAVPHRQSAERVARFVASHDVPGTVVFDRDGAVRAALAADGLPAHVLFDDEGREVARSDRLDASIEAALRRLLDAPTGARRGR